MITCLILYSYIIFLFFIFSADFWLKNGSFCPELCWAVGSKFSVSFLDNNSLCSFIVNSFISNLRNPPNDGRLSVGLTDSALRYKVDCTDLLIVLKYWLNTELKIRWRLKETYCPGKPNNFCSTSNLYLPVVVLFELWDIELNWKYFFWLLFPLTSTSIWRPWNVCGRTLSRPCHRCVKTHYRMRLISPFVYITSGCLRSSDLSRGRSPAQPFLSCSG